MTFSVDEYAYDDDSLKQNDDEIRPTDSYAPANVRRTGPKYEMYQRVHQKSHKYRDDMK